MSALAEGLVGSPDPEDDALVDLGEETVHAALFKEKEIPASPEPRTAVASLDLGPHTAQRRLLDEALDAGWDLDERRGALRPPERLRCGAPNPLACLAECGDPQCGCNRLRNPTVRGSFALKILDNAAPQRPAPGRGGFRSFVAARRLVYASVGCGLLYFDFDVVRRLRKRLAVSTVVLVDEIYREDPPEALGAFAAYFYDVEVLYFGSIASYRAAVRRDGRLAADVLVQCDACSIPRDEVAPLLFFALKVGGAAFKLYNSGHARPDDDGGGGARRNREARVHAEWWRRRGDESRGLASVDYAGARGVLETAATGSTASMWARLWADQRAGVADRARRKGRALYRVVHEPRVAIRDRPGLGGTIVGCLRAGDLVVARRGYDACWPWIALSSLTDRVGVALAEAKLAGRPPPAKLFVLTDGAPVGLGPLLARVADA